METQNATHATIQVTLAALGAASQAAFRWTQIGENPHSPRGVRSRRWTRRKRISALILSWAASPLVLASCVGFGRTVIEVEVDDGPWIVSPTELGDAELTFRFTNMGSQAHQPVVILTSIPPDELPVVEGNVDLANIHIVWPNEGSFSEWPPDHGTDDLFRIVDPGQTVEDAPRALGEGNPGLGTYVVFCYLPGHYEEGEYGIIALVDFG
jgi:hypothetical protein